MRFLFVAWVVTFTAACSSAPATPTAGPGTASATSGTDSRQVSAALPERIDEVAEAQESADNALSDAVSAARAVDDAVGGLREADGVDQTVERWPRVDGAFRSAAVEGLRENLFDVARAVDAARTAVARVRERVEGGWQARYVEAQDELLVAVRRYAETTDELAKTLITYWPVYETVHDDIGEFVDRRSRYRSPQEAANAYELVVDEHLNELAAAQQTIGRALDDRREAAEAVNRAQRRVNEIYARRSGGGTGPAPGPAGGTVLRGG